MLNTCRSYDSPQVIDSKRLAHSMLVGQHVSRQTICSVQGTTKLNTDGIVIGMGPCVWYDLCLSHRRESSMCRTVNICTELSTFTAELPDRGTGTNVAWTGNREDTELIRKRYWFLVEIEANENEEPYADEIWSSIDDQPWQQPTHVTRVEQIASPYPAGKSDDKPHDKS